MAELKQLARRIFQETISAIDIPKAMQRKLRRSEAVLCLDIAEVNLSAFTKVRVIGIGKAAHAMVEGLASLLGREYPLEGIVAAPTPPLVAIAGMKYFVGGHPTPDDQSWKAAESILALLSECDEKTVVFFLLSGGGSALAELPLDGRQTLEDVRQLHRALVTCGAPIEADEYGAKACLGGERRKAGVDFGALDENYFGCERCAGGKRVCAGFRADFAGPDDHRGRALRH